MIAGTIRQRTIGRVDGHGGGHAEPELLETGSPLITKAESPPTMISAAEVITRAVAASPWTTA